MTEPLFRDISADDEAPEITEIESLCMNCHENGMTRFLLTKIPFFKSVVISSFECPHCNERNNEIQPAGEIQIDGIRFTLKVDGLKDLSRQVVKQASAMFRIEELDFEAPPFTSKGVLTTIEGLIQNAMDGLEQQQPGRRALNADLAQKIDDIIGLLGKYKEGEIPFTIIVEDTSGNSFVENPHAPSPDTAMKVEQFKRTIEQSEKLGVIELEEPEEQEQAEENTEQLKDEVLEFPGNCQSCDSPMITKMKMIQIPHFKEVVIMASNCDACGSKSNEVKAGGGIEDKGTRIHFKMTDPTDLTRDVLTSETCVVTIPDLDMELAHSSEAGRFTTIEGLLENIKEGLGRVNPFAFGDSTEKDQPNKLKEVKDKIQQTIDGNLLVSFEFDDPLGNSHVQNTYAPDLDPNLTVERYERTEEINEELGIAQMKTENYKLDDKSQT